MDQSTVQALNTLNHHFYQNNAASFDQSRQNSWGGWDDLWQHEWSSMFQLAQQLGQTIKVLDIGCGNGRFAEFLANKLTETPTISCEYLGLDASLELLNSAKPVTSPQLSCHYQQLDVITTMINSSLANMLDSQTFDLVVGFGVIHHVPSSSLRSKFLEQAISITKKQLCLSWWDFADEPRFASKLVPLSTIGIKTNESETGDWLLGWKNTLESYRYCHSFNKTEIVALIEQSKIPVFSLFKSQHKEDRLNWYSVIKKLS